MSGRRVHYDPSKLHLKKELTQIRKSAKSLRDPGTCSSFKSPPKSSRSATTATVFAQNHTYKLKKSPFSIPTKDGLKGKEKRSVLYNWRSNSKKSSEQKSLSSLSNDVVDGSSSISPRFDQGHAHHNMKFRCGSTKLGSIGSLPMAKRPKGKIKFHRSIVSSSIQKQRRQRVKQVAVHNRKSLDRKLAHSSSVGLSQDASVGLIGQSDDISEQYTSEDLCHSSATSSLLSRLMQKNFPMSSKKLCMDSSYTYSTPALSTNSINRYFNYINPISSESWDDEADDPLDLPDSQGCGIPCYRSGRSTPKYRGSNGSGSQKSNKCHGAFSYTGKERIVSRLPLLNSYGGGGSLLGTGNSDDEVCKSFGELDLEGISRLDGRQWSFGYRSQDSQDDNIMLEYTKTWSQKYRPMFFDELVGQNIVVKSLINAIARGRIAPVYLFQGPRGTGKTSTAKIFAATLNCLATEGNKPCGVCHKCSSSLSCRSFDLLEVSGTNKKGIENVRHLLKKLAVAPPSSISSYKVFVIDDCHLLPPKTWAALYKFLEDPLPQVVFIFITTDLENMPRVILSRCQKHIFNKIKDVEIVSRLQLIAAEESLDLEPGVLDLITLNADGSLQDAETMLEQLSLLGKRITATHVNELVGVVSDEKLLELLELAISSNTAETVKRARDLLDSGADPLILMAQLASLIMDIIAGNCHLDGAKCSTSYYGGGNLTEEELEKFKSALKLLSEAEKQLRVSNERSTWFTATLLQLGTFASPEFTLSDSSRKQSSKTTEDQSVESRDGPAHVQNLNSRATLDKSIHSVHKVSSHDNMVKCQILSSKSDMEKLDHLWLQCIAKCHYEKLRQLLQTYGKLVSLSEVNGVLFAYIAFRDGNIKTRAERYLISITNSLETVLRRSVEVRIIVLPEGLIPVISRDTIGSPNSTPFSRPLAAATEGNVQIQGTKVLTQGVGSIICENGAPLSMNRLRPERNQVLPQDGAVIAQNQAGYMNSEKVECRPISPSLLHQASCAGASLGKEHMGYESGPGGKACSIFSCCYNRHPRREKVTPGTPVRQHKGGPFLCFGECWRSRHG